MHLTARDWSDLRLAAIVLIVDAVIDWLLVRYSRRTENAPLLRMRVLDPCVVPLVIWLFALAPLLERRGLPRWLSVTVLVAIVLTGFRPILRKARREWARAALHRGFGLSGGAAPETLISKEEMKHALYLLLTLGAGVGIAANAMIFSLTVWARQIAGQPVDTTILAIASGAGALALFVPAYAKLGRWPGTFSNSATIDVAAPPTRVWDALALRDSYAGWRAIYTSTERLDEPGEVYRIHRAESSRCRQCSPPRQPDRALSSIRVEVVEAVRPSLYSLRSVFECVVPHKGDLAQASDYGEDTWRLQPLAGGGTRVTYSAAVVRPKASLVFWIIFSGAPRGTLRSLKTHVEGAPDESVFGFSGRRIQAARNAPRHCACSA